MSCIPELTGSLSGGAIELRAISEWDIPEILVAHEDDPQLHARLGLAKPPTGAQLGSQVENAAAARAAGVAVAFTIVDAGGRDCRGRVEITAIDWDAGRAEARAWVVPERRGRGYAKEALELAGAWLRENADLAQLEIVAVCDD